MRQFPSQWATARRAELNDFVKWWDGKHKEHPELFPTSLTPEQWVSEFNRWKDPKTRGT